MFYYFGTKNRLARYYPKPAYKTTIEPFAGAAGYSLYGNNWKNDVILIDPFEKIIAVWEYLIAATAKDIMSLPDVHTGDDIREHKQLSDAELWLIGFCLNHGGARPKLKVGEWDSVRESGLSPWARRRAIIAKNIHKVNHWKIIQGVYTDAPDIEACWFVDPPYQYGGDCYTYSNKTLDYGCLKQWCLERKGQIIVCENTKADWMNFKPLRSHYSYNSVRALSNTESTTMEAVYLRGGSYMKKFSWMNE